MNEEIIKNLREQAKDFDPNQDGIIKLAQKMFRYGWKAALLRVIKELEIEVEDIREKENEQ